MSARDADSMDATPHAPRLKRGRNWPLAALLLLVAGRAAAQATPAELTLEQAVDFARDHAPEIAQARASVQAAQARVEAARSPLLPQLSGALAYERRTNNGGQSFGSGPDRSSRASLESLDYYSASLRGTQLIYDFGQSHGGLDAAKASAQAEVYGARASWLATEYGVRSAYLSAAAARALIKVALDNLHNQERHMQQIEGFVQVGTRPAIDLAQARTDVANARLQKLRAESDYSVAKTRLERAMGHKPTGAYEVSEALPGPEPDENASLTSLLEKAERDRPEFAELSQRVRAQDYTVSANQAAHAPSLQLQADVSETGYALDELAFNAGVGVSLTVPFFQGGLVGARVDEARAALAELRSQREALLADARMQLEQAVLSLRAAQSAREIAGEVVVNAAERLTLAEGRYNAGVGNVIELADAQLVLSTAQSQVVSADYEVALARAQLRSALGRASAPPK